MTYVILHEPTSGKGHWRRSFIEFFLYFKTPPASLNGLLMRWSHCWQRKPSYPSKKVWGHEYFQSLRVIWTPPDFQCLKASYFASIHARILLITCRHLRDIALGGLLCKGCTQWSREFSLGYQECPGLLQWIFHSYYCPVYDVSLVKNGWRGSSERGENGSKWYSPALQFSWESASQIHD